MQTDIATDHAARLRARAAAYGSQPAGNFLVYGEKEAAEDRAAAEAIEAIEARKSWRPHIVEKDIQGRVSPNTITSKQ